MKHQLKTDLLFKSNDIKVTIRHSSSLEKQLPHTIEGKSTFNLLFFLSSPIYFEIPPHNTPFSFKENQYILYYHNNDQNLELGTKDQNNLNYLHIEINYQYIFKLINPQSNPENTDIMEKMEANKFIFLHPETPPKITVEMHVILHEIACCSRKGILQKLFLEAKTIRLLFLIFQQFYEKTTTKELTQSSAIIKKYIDENYDKNIKIQELSKIAGLNQNKIRKEFKSQYNTTLTNYISELKMLKAQQLISSNMMIKEVAIECGYEYVQNFTRAFKKKFGISPEKLKYK